MKKEMVLFESDFNNDSLFASGLYLKMLTDEQWKWIERALSRAVLSANQLGLDGRRISGGHLEEELCYRRFGSKRSGVRYLVEYS